MALERDDLDELNRPPRHLRTISDKGERSGGERDGQMGELTTGEILLAEVRDMKRLLNEAVVPQLATLRVQVDNHETAIRDLNTWRDNLPEKKRQQQQQDQAAWWQTTNGKINIALAALIVITTIAPLIAAHWH